VGKTNKGGDLLASEELIYNNRNSEISYRNFSSTFLSSSKKSTQQIPTVRPWYDLEKLNMYNLLEFELV
jgi:hypothetical protein